eukprot:9034350-Pyramimonas_sp.AAC.1
MPSNLDGDGTPKTAPRDFHETIGFLSWGSWSTPFRSEKEFQTFLLISFQPSVGFGSAPRQRLSKPVLGRLS